MKKISSLDYKILSELIKNSKVSDRKLAKKLGVSQPTVTRRRARLENNRLLSYTAVPDFSRLGFEIMAITFLSVKSELRFPKDTSQLKGGILFESSKISDDFYSENPNILVSATGRGLDKNAVMISIHEDYSSMVEFLRQYEQKFGQVLNNIETFSISTRSDRIRRLFNLNYFADYIEKVKTSERVEEKK
jgi:DNA-binding Lrp family transcriptional regulator